MIIRFYHHNKTYGGVEFCDYDTGKGEVWRGNLASTARPLTAWDIEVKLNSDRAVIDTADAIVKNGAKDRGRV